jgi:uncharacterized protein (TIGR03067 family)
MRLLTILLLICIVAGCTNTKIAGSHTGKLNGTWIPVKQEMGGKQLPAIVFEKQRLMISDTTYTFTAESVDKGTVKYDGTKMDIYGREGVNAGKRFNTIYKYDKGMLIICYNLMGTGYPETFETKDKTGFFLSVFKREKKK